MIYFITINYNGWQDTITLINSLFESPYKDYKIIVVDNFSTDESVKMITDHLGGKTKKNKVFVLEEKNGDLEIENLPIVILIKSKINRGFAGGNNLAFNFLAKYKKKSDLFWLINNDTIVSETAISNLLNYVDSLTDEKFAIGTKSLIMNSNNQVDSEGWGYLNLLNGKARHSDKYFGFYLKYLVGSSIVLNEIQQMDDKFFLYFEDADYSLILKQNGFKLLYCQDSVIYHKCNSTANKVTIVKQFKLDSQLYFYKKRYFHLLPLIFLQRFIFYIIFFKYKELKYLLNSLKRIIIYG